MDPGSSLSQAHVRYSRDISKFRGSQDSFLRPRAVPTAQETTRPHRRRHVSTNSSPLKQRLEDSNSPSFTDEYDLALEDPQILQDVQRALKGKARRDARVKAGLPSPSPPQPESAATTLVGSSSPRIAGHHTFSSSVSAPLGLPLSHVDFRPSTAAPPSSSHPIPRSTDNGATLDWSYHEDHGPHHEKKWSRTLSLSKSREKNAPPLTSMNTQEHLYFRHIDGIRSRASPQTLYKAELVARQLGRRYAFLETQGETLLRVFHWYSAQTPLFRSELEESEPFLWLSHYDHDRRKRGHFDRSPRYFSALVIEHYQQSVASLQAFPTSSPALPDDQNISRLSLPNSNRSLLYPFSSLRSSNPASLSQDDVSFGPDLRSARNSFESRRSAESFPSIPDASRSREILPSPNSSRLRIRDFSYVPQNLDEVLPGRPSVSEEPGPPEQTKQSEIDMTPSDSQSGLKVVVSRPPSDNISASRTPFSVPDDQGNSLAVLTSNLEQQPDGPSATRILGKRKIRTSLPSSSHPPVDLQELHRREQEDEERLRQEYERKAHLVNALQADNARTRMLLNRIAIAIREYEATYSRVMRRLGLPHVEIPPEVLDAFSHDPAAVTHGTRLHSGWRATEDIHERVTRQRQIFRAFIANNGSLANGPPRKRGVLEQPIAALLEILRRLEDERGILSLQEADVVKLLQEVQVMEAEARAAYEQTSTITSVVYPELSSLASLEEGYKAQYKRVWDWSMDALTLLFDNIAPFWRTYGRTILDDVIAFLVIPLYRNEFTGEHKRYKIERIPRRSFRHWVGLILFLGSSVAVLLAHGRATISWLSYFSLPNISHPGVRYALIPVFWIFILFQCFAVICEAAVVALQVVIWFWWLGWTLRIVS